MTIEERLAVKLHKTDSSKQPDYMDGFGNTFSTEALEGALPLGRNAPQKVKYGLYTEQVSGSMFTAPRATNRRSWLYRIRPGVQHVSRYRRIEDSLIRTAPVAQSVKEAHIGPLRWDPFEVPSEELTFVTGLRTITTAGDASQQIGSAVHIALITRSMGDEYFVNFDGELLIIPQQGGLRVRTELGVLDVRPSEICVVPRGMIFKVELLDGPARAYVAENYGRPLVLPELGPIGANGLANPRDFLTPVAAYEDREVPSVLSVKASGEVYVADVASSPLDVVAWHGNHVPYKYNLRNFCSYGPVRFDHGDPSIHTVLTSPSEIPGFANMDFLVFMDRWEVTEDTFRPQWFHRNFASEFLGAVFSPATGPGSLSPGSMMLHNQMLPHGVESDVYEAGRNAKLEPKLGHAGRLAFMFETRLVQKPTEYARGSKFLEKDYDDSWKSLTKHFAK